MRAFRNSMNSSIDAALGARRRGAFLVFVIGVLGLLSVITISYVAIGVGDRETVRTLEERQDYGNVANEIRDYLGAVIADDLFVATLDPVDPSLALREVSDYPSTSELVTMPLRIGWSNATENNGDPVLYATELFTPAGAGNTDPWLAASSPVWLRSEFTVQNGNVVPPSGSAVVGEEIVRRNDWAHISNFAPDGRFVNLFHLRGYKAGDAQPMFEKPSTALSFRYDGDELQRDQPLLTLTYERVESGAINGREDFVPSSGLSVIGGDQASLSPLELYNPLREASIPGNAQGTAIAPEKPSLWTANQVGAAIPLVPEAWDNSASMQYQWADADGDGIADSRWFEFVAPEIVIDSSPGDPVADAFGYRSLLSNPGELRWFVAARAVDLSGRVDVNVATDFRRLGDGSAGSDLPVGLTPADIDLRRLLTMQDALKDDTENGFSSTAAGAVVGPNLAWDDPAIPSTVGEDLQPSEHPDPDVWALNGADAFIALQQRLDLNWNTATTAIDVENTLDQRNRLFKGLVTGPQSVSLSNQVNPEPFGIASLAELLTFNGLNDPNTLSPLESVMLNGSFDQLPLAEIEPFTSPLRSGRSLDGELARWPVDRDRDSGDIRDNLERDAVLAFTDPRRRITTVSGARPLRSVARPGVASTDPLEPPRLGSLLPYELQIDALAALERANSVDSAVAFEGVEQLYLGYAEALAPYAWVDEVWPVIASNPLAAQRQYWPLFYGQKGPDFALMTAAHLAVNMADLYDTDSESTAVTLKLAETFTPGSSNWNNDARTLDLTQILGDAGLTGTFGERLAPAGSPPGDAFSGAINIYGIEAQPMITRAGWFGLYLDAPESGTGSPDGDNSREELEPRELPGGVIIIGNGSIDISFSRVRSNGDFVGDFFAVQLHNPFEVAVDLSPGDQPFYVEFGGQFYVLGEQLPGAGGVFPASPGKITDANATLAPGETKIFVGSYLTPDEMQSRVDRLREVQNYSSGFPADPYGNAIYELFIEYFSVTSSGDAPHLLVPYEPGGDLVGAANVLPSPATTRASVLSATPELNEDIMLWQRLEPFAEIGDDRMIDRISTRGQGVDTFAPEHLPVGRVEISGRAALQRGDADPNGDYEPDADVDGVNINTGLTHFAWVTVERPNESSGGINFGAIEPWMIESKGFTAQSTSLNDRKRDEYNEDFGEFSRAKQASDNQEYYDTLWDFFDLAVGMGASAPTANTGAIQRWDLGEGVGLTAGSGVSIGATIDGRSFAEATDEIHHDTRTVGGSAFRREVQYDSDADVDLVSVVRLTDLLLPFGFGPRFDPYAFTNTFNATGGTAPVLVTDPSDGVRIQQLRRGWVTLPEALAAVLNYDESPHGRIFEFAPSFQIGSPLPRTVAGLQLPPALDRGRLRMDSYIPFLDGDAGPSPVSNGIRDNAGSPLLGEGDPAILTSPNEPLVSRGIPMAMDVLNQFRIYGSDLGSVPSPKAVDRVSAFGDLRTRIPGQININTADEQVLRTIPMLSPIDRTDVGTAASDQWWWNAPSGVDRWNSNFDVGAAVLAYREKGVAYSRPGGAAATQLIDVRDTKSRGQDEQPLGDQEEVLEMLPLEPPDGRAKFTGITGIREQPGFGSPGELLAVRSPADPIHSIDALGRPPTPSQVTSIGREGVDYRYGAAGDQDDGLANDYDEQLAIAAGAMNSISTRSDVFAVWFVVHGYAESDVLGLGVDDPLIPSVARRFVVVFDRSNVVDPSDAPEVLLFKELPIEPVRPRTTGEADDSSGGGWDWQSY